ncbi:MAG: hypothetical protein ACPGED_06660 [Flavobacteriales bacterium]
MRKLLTILTFVTISLNSFGQENWSRKDKRDWDEGDFAFYQGEFTRAKTLLEPLLEKDPSYIPLKFELGATYIQLGIKTPEALNLLEEAIKTGHSESVFFYARALHQSHRFDESLEAFSQYQSFKKREQDADLVTKYVNECIRARESVLNPIDVTVNNMGPKVNGPYKEYVPVVTGNNSDLYFTSRRPNSTGQLLDFNDEYFEDIYHSKQTDGEWSQAVQLGGELNSRTHDATVSISSDGSKMIIYRTNLNLTGGDLYITEKVGSSWSSPKKLGEQINSPYQEASACFGRDNKTLYFSSNRPGGYGGKDLYRVVILPNGEWSLPKNLGPTVNSGACEMVPFVSRDEQTLYFTRSKDGKRNIFQIDFKPLLDKLK